MGIFKRNREPKKAEPDIKIVKVDEENNLLLVQGAIPGFNGASVIIKPAVKAK
jgi:large subunit ribosomal protein L3